MVYCARVGRVFLEDKILAEYNLIDYFKEIGVQQYKTDVGFRTLVESVDENLYVIPKYQRKYRWTKDQAAALVESLLCGLPIPPIYTCRNTENQLEILDGQQRIMSLFFYYIGYYLDKKKNSAIDFSGIMSGNCPFRDAMMNHYAMEEFHIELEGRDGTLINADYAALPVEMKRRVDYTAITIIEIKIDNEKRRSKILRQIFANLNKGGSLLTQQEQRNGIYSCAFYDMLQDMNRNHSGWRKLWGREDAKERDMEALLRLCALRKYVSVRQTLLNFEFVIDGYVGSYAKMLDRFSEEAMDFDEKQIMTYRESLVHFFELFCVNVTQSSKVALLESFYVVYEKKGVRQMITSEIYNRILENPKYISYARQGTVKMKNMNERWKSVYEIWEGNNL